MRQKVSAKNFYEKVFNLRLKIEKIIIEMNLDFARKVVICKILQTYHKTKQTFWKAKSLEKCYK